MQADAQNSALIECMKDGGIVWIHRPQMRPVPEGEMEAVDGDGVSNSPKDLMDPTDCKMGKIQQPGLVAVEMAAGHPSPSPVHDC